MEQTKPSIVPLHELSPGQSGDFFAMLAEKQPGSRKDGKPFFTCRFRDVQRSVAFMVWSDGKWFDECSQQWQAGQFYKIRGRYGEHAVYGPQIDIQNLRPVNDEDEADGFDPFSFVTCSRFDRDEMFADLLELAENHIDDEGLANLVKTILERREEQLKYLPASLRHFHPFCGGWLEHVLSVTQTCIELVEKYQTHYADLQPPLNKDLVVGGAILHDIGKSAEMSGSPLPTERTTAGQLFGHLILGRDIVRETAAELDGIEPELVQLLEHIVLTHLSIPEWGSPRLPVIPEVLIIHHADDLDAKMEMYARCLSEDKEPGEFTARDPILKRQLYKGRKV